jgi:divalent metal cation (Fe/Co/Zn/Cd) transporter
MSEHNCDHIHPEDAPMRFAKYGNFVVGSAGLAVGAFTGSSAVLADAVHNFSDAFAHNGHIDATEVERHHGGTEKLSKTRKRAALLFGGGAVVVGAYSGIQLFNAEPGEGVNKAAVIMELASVGLNGTVAYRFSKQKDRLQGQDDSHSHNAADFVGSVIALAGVSAVGFNEALYKADSIAGLAVSGITITVAARQYISASGR